MPNPNPMATSCRDLPPFSQNQKTHCKPNTIQTTTITKMQYMYCIIHNYTTRITKRIGNTTKISITQQVKSSPCDTNMTDRITPPLDGLCLHLMEETYSFPNATNSDWILWISEQLCLCIHVFYYLIVCYSATYVWYMVGNAWGSASAHASHLHQILCKYLQ